MRFILALLLTIVLSPAFAAAQYDAMEDNLLLQDRAATTSAAHHPVEHPVLSHDAQWAGLMVMFVIAMFVAAAAVGILAVDMNKMDEVPDAHGQGHDDHAHGHDAHQ